MWLLMKMVLFTMKTVCSFWLKGDGVALYKDDMAPYEKGVAHCGDGVFNCSLWLK